MMKPSTNWQAPPCTDLRPCVMQGQSFMSCRTCFNQILPDEVVGSMG